jgi:hypothetical protein
VDLYEMDMRNVDLHTNPKRRRNVANATGNTISTEPTSQHTCKGNKSSIRQRILRYVRKPWSIASHYTMPILQYVGAWACFCLPFSVLEWLGIVTPEIDLQRQKQEIQEKYRMAGLPEPLQTYKPPYYVMQSLHTMGDTVEVTEF